MLRLLTTCSILSLGAALSAQSPAMQATPPPPPPMPQAIPVTAPPVDHPAYAAQPLMPRSTEPTPTPPKPTAKPKDKKKDKKAFVPPVGPVPGAAGAAPAGPDAAEVAAAEAAAALAAAKKAADEFEATKIEGKELRVRVDRVLKQLHWNETLEAAAVEACANDKPIVWVQMLGDVDGFT